MRRPFTYRTARALFAGTGREIRVNLAVRRTPKPHVTIRYLEPDFTAMFLAGLRGLMPGGTADAGYHGRELARNAAVAGVALATGLRRQEFTYLLPWEIPALPARPTTMPVPFPVPAGVTKGRKFRTTWVSYDALAEVHRYLELDRAATADGSPWRPPPQWGEPLLVTEPDERGGRVNGVRRRWETLTPGERRRLVAPDGGSCLLAVKNGGGPFTAWATVFERASDPIRATSEPRFPHVTPHRLRHIFSALFRCRDNRHRWVSGPAACAVLLPSPRCRLSPEVVKRVSLPPGRPTATRMPLNTASAGTRHTFSMRTLEYLVTGHYRQAARVVKDADADAALVFYLSKADPLLVLRDLLGHSTVLTTEKYLRRLDTTRIYRDAYEHAGAGSGLMSDQAAEREAGSEFAGDGGDT